MSVRVLSKVWDGFPKGGTHLLAMLALADWSDDEGRCWPSIKSIALKIRLKERQAQRAVNYLINNGYVKILHNKFGGAPGSTRHYQINISTFTGVAIDPPKYATGVVNGLGGCHSTPLTGVAGDTQTVIEPSLEPLKKFEIDFNRFWTCYPKKVGKKKAFEKWVKIKPSIETIIEALYWQIKSEGWQNGFIPNPSTYLEEERWNDEPLAVIRKERGLVL